jgi:D-aminoacyl-tRNA deacylase
MEAQCDRHWRRSALRSVGLVPAITHGTILILAVSQFTLFASTKKGNKPDFHKSAGGEKGKALYSAFFHKVQELYGQDKVKDGVFQAHMDVALVNDGPVGVSDPCLRK